MLTCKPWSLRCGCKETQSHSNGCTSFHSFLRCICFWSEQNWVPLSSIGSKLKLCWNQVKFFPIPSMFCVSSPRTEAWGTIMQLFRVSASKELTLQLQRETEDSNEASHRSSAKSLFPPVKAVPIALAVRADRSALWNFVSLVAESPGGVSLGNLSNSLRH